MKLIRVSRGSGMRVGPGEDAILEAFKPGTGPPDTFVNPNATARGGGGGSGAVTSGTGGLY
jgi:penicillin-binding protein 1A